MKFKCITDKINTVLHHTDRKKIIYIYKVAFVQGLNISLLVCVYVCVCEGVYVCVSVCV